MSIRECSRRKLVSCVLKQAWRYFRRNVHGMSFSEALILAWRTVRGLQRLIYSKARGVSKRNDDGMSRQRILRTLMHYHQEDVILSFERESDNFYDSYAVRIMAETDDMKPSLIGYVSAEIARELAPLLDAGNTPLVFFLGVTGEEIHGLNFAFSVIPGPLSAIRRHGQERKNALRADSGPQKALSH